MLKYVKTPKNSIKNTQISLGEFYNFYIKYTLMFYVCSHFCGFWLACHCATIFLFEIIKSCNLLIFFKNGAKSKKKPKKTGS